MRSELPAQRRVTTEFLAGAVGGMVVGGLVGLIEGVRQSGAFVSPGAGGAGALGGGDAAFGLLGAALLHIGLGFCIGAVMGAACGGSLGAAIGLLLRRRPGSNPWRVAAAVAGLALVIVTLASPGLIERLLLPVGLVSPPALGR